MTEEVPQVRRETMWIELLEGIPQKEAEMIDLVKDGKWPFKNVTIDIVKSQSELKDTGATSLKILW